MRTELIWNAERIQTGLHKQTNKQIYHSWNKEIMGQLGPELPTH